MTDWIYRLKQQHRNKEQDQRELERHSQRRFELVRSMLPEFLDRAMRSARVQIDELKAALPEHPEYHLDLEDRAPLPGFVVTSPTRELTLQVDETRTLLRCIESGRGMTGTRPLGSIDLTVELTKQDKLSVEFRRRLYNDPERFAEAVVRFMAGAE